MPFLGISWLIGDGIREKWERDPQAMLPSQERWHGSSSRPESQVESESGGTRLHRLAAWSNPKQQRRDSATVSAATSTITLPLYEPREPSPPTYSFRRESSPPKYTVGDEV